MERPALLSLLQADPRVSPGITDKLGDTNPGAICLDSKYVTHKNGNTTTWEQWKQKEKRKKQTRSSGKN
jgi:hypothetical protein